MRILARVVTVSVLAALWACAPADPRPPVAAARPSRLASNEHLRIDDYYWLRNRDDPDVIAYLEAENIYADAIMSTTVPLQEELFREFAERIRQTDTSVPVLDHDHLYYRRSEEGQEYEVCCRRRAVPGADEEVLIDINEIAVGHEFCSVAGPVVSPESDIMAWAEDIVGRRRYTLKFRNLDTGELFADEIRDVTDNFAWYNDGVTLLYTRQDPETLRPFQIWRHVVGTDPADDVLVYEETDETFSVEVSKTESGRYLLIDSQQTLASEVRLVDADDATSAPVLVAPRERGVEYHVSHHGERLLIRTNLEAENFRLLAAPVSSPGRASWKELVPHRDDVLLEGVHVFRDFLVLSERRRGLTALTVVELAEGGRHEIEVDDPVSEIWFGDNRVYESAVLRFVTSSLTTPDSVFDYDMRTRKRTLLKRDEILGGYDPSDYVSERLLAPAGDGVEVPISIVRRRGLPLDGSAPLLLHGYGAYGSSSEPTFDPQVISLLERGFSYAIAHVRGGQELGRRWYEDGKLLNKNNTFSDFIACAEFLIEHGYTSPDRLVARGRSAGGLLMGAVANMAPELFAAIVTEVPFVDVVTTMLDDRIPLTTAEYDEWGDPREPRFYEVMLAYSPYDNVEEKDYPAILVTTALHDSQVQYWEPAKWVAKLRARKTDDRPLLLRTNMAAGHGGASGRYQAYRETAEQFAFMLWVVASVD